MTDELQEYYDTLVFKDNAHTRYFFDITAKMGEMAYPIISIVQNRKNATGAETFKNAIAQISNNKKITSVVVTEYSNCCDDAEPITTNEFELKKTKKMAKKKSTTPQTFNGFGNLGEANSFLEGFGKSLGMLGVEGGLSGIIRSSAAMISQQDKLETALGQITELKSKNTKLEDNSELLKKEIADLKDQLTMKRYELMDIERKKDNEIADLKRDLKHSEESYQNKLSLGNLATTAVFGVLAKKFKLEEKLDGLLSDDDTTVAAAPQPQPTADLSSVNLEPSNPETAAYIEDINKYLGNLDKSRMELVATIIQYISLGDNELKKVYSTVSNLYQNRQKNGNGTTAV